MWFENCGSESNVYAFMLHVCTSLFHTACLHDTKQLFRSLLSGRNCPLSGVSSTSLILADRIVQSCGFYKGRYFGSCHRVLPFGNTLARS